jgi:hypothetical protein
MIKVIVVFVQNEIKFCVIAMIREDMVNIGLNNRHNILPNLGGLVAENQDPILISWIVHLRDNHFP